MNLIREMLGDKGFRPVLLSGLAIWLAAFALGLSVFQLSGMHAFTVANVAATVVFTVYTVVITASAR